MTHRRQPPSAHIRLPPLAADEALRLVAFLERVTDAIWRAHGEQMSERLLDRAVRHPTPRLPLDRDDSDLPF